MSLTNALFPLAEFSCLYHSILPRYLPKASLTPLYSERVVLLEYVLSSLLSISLKIPQVAQKHPSLSDKMIRPLL